MNSLDARAALANTSRSSESLKTSTENGSKFSSNARHMSSVTLVKNAKSEGGYGG